MYTVALLTSTLLALVGARIYERCELARDLLQLGVRKDHIATWVCIAYHESRFDTAARNPSSGDHGLLQISEIYWCGAGKACGLPCSALRDDDISDDVECALSIYEEHTRIQGNGFLAWVVYPHYCKHNAKKYLADCDHSAKDVSYKFEDRGRTSPVFYESYPNINFTLSNPVQSEFSYSQSDRSVPSFLSIVPLLRGKFEQDFERDYNKNKRVNWAQFKIDNVDDLKLPDFSGIRKFNFLQPITTQISTTSTTTMEPKPQYKPVKPWRTIETNQFRRRMMKFNNTPLEEMRNNTTNENSLVVTTPKLVTSSETTTSRSTSTIRIINEKDKSVSNNACCSPVTQSSKVTSFATQKPVTIFTTQRPVTSITTQRPVTVFETQRPTIPFKTQRPITSYTTPRPAISFKTQRPAISFTTQRPATSFTTQRPETSSTTQSPAISFKTQRPAISFTTQRPATSFTTQRPETTSKTQSPAISFPTQKPETSFTTQRPATSLSLPITARHRWLNSFENVPKKVSEMTETRVKSFWDTFGYLTTQSPKLKSMSFTSKTLEAYTIKPYSSTPSNIQLLSTNKVSATKASGPLPSTTKVDTEVNNSINLKKITTTQRPKEILSTTPAVPRLPVTKPTAFTWRTKTVSTERYTQRYSPIKSYFGEYTTERPQTVTWRRGKLWSGDYQNVTPFSDARPVITHTTTESNIPSTTTTKYLNQDTFKSTNSLSSTTVTLSPFSTSTALSQSNSSHVPIERQEMTERLVTSITPATPKTTFSIFDIYLNPSKRQQVPNYEVLFSENRDSNFKIFSRGTTAAPVNRNISIKT